MTAARLPLLVLTLALAFGGEAGARFHPDQKASLASLPGVYVVVEDLAPEAAKDGLTRAIVLQDVLSRLTAAGMPLLPRARWLKTPGWPTLSVIVAAYKSRLGVYAVFLSVRLRQVVALKRNPVVEVAATTWSAEFVAVTRPDRLLAVRRYLIVLVDRFIRAWRSAGR